MKVFEEYLKQNHAKLTCYVQTPNDELPHLRQRPGVLILPGGGYTMCSAREAEPVALAYLHAGYQAFVLEYSTVDRHSREGMAAVFPKVFADGVEAMEYLRGHAEALSLLSDKAAAVGFSAGPNLLETVTSETSPMFMFNSQGDTVTPATNTLRLSLTLAEAGVAYETHTFLTGDHGLSLATAAATDDGGENADVAQWHTMSLRFLQNLWEKETSGKPELSINSKIGTLLKDSGAVAALNEVLPGVADRLRANPMAHSMTFAMMAKVSGGMIPEAALQALDAKLNAL